MNIKISLNASQIDAQFVNEYTEQIRRWRQNLIQDLTAQESLSVL